MKFRKAHSDDNVSEMLYLASPELMDYVFRFEDCSPDEFLTYDYKRGGGLFGYKSIYVSEENSIPIATLTAYHGRDYLLLTMKTLISAFRYFNFLRFIIILKRSIVTSRQFINPSSQCVYIANGYVLPQYRFPGVFSSLVDCAEKLAIDRNLEYVECDVSYKNERSLKIHQFFGFKVIHESPYSGSNPLLDGVRRLRLKLEVS